MPFIRENLRSRHAGLVLAGVLLSGCGGGSDVAKGPPQLHLACQTVECECREKETALFAERKIVPIVWRLNGDATCPAGYVLERVEVDFLGRRR